VEAKEHELRLDLPHAWRGRFGEASNVARVIVERGHDLDLENVPHPRGRREHRVYRRRGRCRAVLLIEREDDDAGDAPGVERVERRGDRRRTVTHGELDQDRLAAARLDFGRQVPTVDEQRRTPIGPDLGIGFRRPLWTKRKDEDVQRKPPQRRRRVDDARVGEELAEIAAHFRRARGVGRSEVDEQKADVGARHGP
jgi:hypothetical protein